MRPQLKMGENGDNLSSSMLKAFSDSGTGDFSGSQLALQNAISPHSAIRFVPDPKKNQENCHNL
jgi:hypothetical protein